MITNEHRNVNHGRLSDASPSSLMKFTLGFITHAQAQARHTHSHKEKRSRSFDTTLHAVYCAFEIQVCIVN